MKIITPTPFQEKVIHSGADFTIIAGGMGCGKKTVLEALINSNLIRADYHLVASAVITNISHLKDANLTDRRIIICGLDKHHIHNFAAMEFGYQYLLKLHEIEENDFLYLTSRLRNKYGDGKFYATINPSQAPDWLKNMCEWWIGKPERSGALRYYCLTQDGMLFGESKDEVINKLPPKLREQLEEYGVAYSAIRSMTVISAYAEENEYLKKLDSSYYKRLKDAGMENHIKGEWR